MNKRIIFYIHVLLLVIPMHIIAVGPAPELLKFNLKFGILKGGEVMYKISDSTYNQQAALHTKLHGYTTGFADLIWAVNDHYASLLNKENLLPHWSTKNLSEQDFTMYEHIQYDHINHVVVSNRKGKFKVDKNICDVSALICNIRYSGVLENLEVGQILKIPFWDTNEWYYLEIKYTGIEKVKTAFGTFNCIRLEPQHVTGRFFNKKNPMNVWISTGSRKLPVLMQLNFTIGSVKCELVEYE